MRDILPTLARWHADGRRVALATVVERRGSAPRDPGASLALNDLGEIAGSVTGGCVEPAVIREAQEVLDGGPARVREYGIADDEAAEVGLSCGGTVGILIAELDTSLVPALHEAVGSDLPAAFALTASGERIGEQWLHDGSEGPVARLLAGGESALADIDGAAVFVHSLLPRPQMYIFGAIDHASALARVGRLLGYRVTVCDARARFVTPARFPEADELVVDWPDTFLRGAAVDSRTAICVLTHDAKFDVPAIVAALDDARRVHRRDGQQGDDRRPRGAAARRGRQRGRHRAASTRRSGYPSAPARPKRSPSRSARRSSRRRRRRDAQRPPSPASSAC